MRVRTLAAGARARLLRQGAPPALALAAAAASIPAPALAGRPLALPEPQAPGESLPVVRHVLPNGMTFLILERRQSPTAALVVHYAVGSVNEHLGSTGTAHVLEHLMFKGSREIGTTDHAREAVLLEAVDAARDSMIAAMAGARPDSARARRFRRTARSLEDQARAFVIPNEFDQLLSAEGARGLNATTSHEATRYFVELPANRLELWFALESDRMANPVFREFLTELDVVAEERRLRLETSPGGVLERAFLATAFHVHPYGVPVVGHSSDLETLTRAQVRAFFRAHYGPRNAVAAVVGDVDADQVKEWADEYFGPLPAGVPSAPVLAREPEQAGERRITVEFEAEPRLLVGWRAVDSRHEDAPALSMLAAVLSAGRTTRLYRRLVAGDRSAVHVAAYLGPGTRHPGLFVVSAVPRAPHAPADVEAAVYEEIARLKATPPDSAALSRIRNQLRAGELRRLASNLGLAQQLAQSEAELGDWRETFRAAARLARVTPDQVSRAARTYLIARRRTVATMVAKTPS